MDKSIQINLLGETPIEVVRKNLNIYKIMPNKCVFGWSTGDDSTMLVDVAVEMFGPDIPVVFINTGIEFKESYDFIPKMVDYWGLTNFHIIKDYNEHFVKIARRVGLHGIGHNKMICCTSLKNDPLSRWMKANGKTISISGIRRNEGKRSCKYQITQYNSRFKIRYHSPMLFLDKEDVDDYFCETGCPKNPLYGMGLDRTGCAVCPNPLKLRRYSKEYSTYYDLLADKFPKWYRYAWGCQRMFYKNKCPDGDTRGYGNYLYRHKWKWPILEGIVKGD